MGVRLDARRDPQQHRRPTPSLGRQSVEAVELLEAVDHDAAHASLDGGGQGRRRLVVSVHHQPLGREPGR